MNVALIPVRGGSKSIPLKNIKKLNDRPLVYWTVKAACDCPQIDKVYVATDSLQIRETVEKFGLEKVIVIDRDKNNSSDTASTESVMLEFANRYQFDTIVLIQATSPLLTTRDLEKGFLIYEDEKYDSVLSAVKQKRFNWRIDDSGIASPINYDVYNRPRRQEFEGYFVENGAFYITSKRNLLSTGNRVSGNIGIVEMPEDTYFEIDEPSDWIVVEHLMKKREDKKCEEIPLIQLFLTDCDGCLTDGGMYYTNSGDEMKRFNTLDGMGFALLHQHNIKTGIITGEDVNINKRRSEKMQLDIYAPGIKDKLKELKRICDEYKISLENVAYIGDDVNDIEAMKVVGFPCAVKNAMPSVKKVAKYVTENEGGRGAIREVVEMILKSSMDSNNS